METSYNVYSDASVARHNSQVLDRHCTEVLEPQEQVTKRQYAMVLASLSALNATIGELLSVSEACREVGLHDCRASLNQVVAKLDSVHRVCADLLGRASMRRAQEIKPSQGPAQ